MTSRLQPLQSAAGTHPADFVPAYHNCGPIPNNVYRTGAVGVQVDLSSHYIIRTLLEAATLTHPLVGCTQGGFGARLHPALIHGAACVALLRLQASAAVARSANAFLDALASAGSPADEPATRRMLDSAIDAIVLLRDVLRDHQLLPPFHGLVSCVANDHVRQHKALPWLSCRADDRIVPLAWGLVAIACVSPPILLFNRQPSLIWFREGHSLLVRWFGVAVPIASAPASTGVSQ